MMEIVQKSTKITLYSFMLALLIICLHCVHILKPHFEIQTTWADVAVHSFFTDFLYRQTNLAVPSFFLISAFLFFRNYTIIDTKEKIVKRFHSLFIPYICWNIISVIWLFVVFNLPMADQFIMSEKEEFSVYNIVIRGILLSKYNLLWFVGVLMIYNIFCWFIWGLLRFKLGGAILIIIGIFVWPYFDNMKILGLGWLSPIVYGVGAYLGIHYPRIHNYKFNIKSSYIALSLLIIITSLDVTYIPLLAHGSYLIMLLRLVFILIEMVLLWIAFDLIPPTANLHWIISQSFFIYLVHRYFLKIVCHLCLLITKQIDSVAVSESITYIVSISLTIVASLFAAKLWIKISPRSYAVMTGYRSA